MPPTWSSPAGAGATRRGCLTDAEIAARLNRAPGAVADAQAAHIDECSACQRLIAEAARALGSGSTASQLRTLADGERVSARYVVSRFVGAGGMGEVYEAVDEELAEPVALKTLAIALLDDGAAERRLKSEVQLARKVTHPNVCRIFDFGVHTRIVRGAVEAIPFFTMELLAGESLARRIERTGGLRVDDAFPIALQIVDGLQAVHAAGVLHRDLKPDNVFLVGDGRRVVLMDFGLAKAPTATVRHSITGQAVGTAGYMSPEQVEGKPASASSDVYAFGVVVHELLSGKLPFSGSTPMALAADRLRRPPVPLREHDPSVPVAWERFVLRCLAREPQDRFADAAAVRAALLALQAPAGIQPRRPLRRRIAAVVGATVAGGVAVAAWNARDAVPAAVVVHPVVAPAPPMANARATAAPVSAPLATSQPPAPPRAASPVDERPVRKPPGGRRLPQRSAQRSRPLEASGDAERSSTPPVVPAASPAERPVLHPDAPFNPFDRR